MESVERSIKDLEGIVDIAETMRRFNKLKYEEAQGYPPERIVNLRKQAHMSNRCSLCSVISNCRHSRNGSGVTPNQLHR